MIETHADLVHFAMENGNDLFHGSRFGNHAGHLFELSGLQIEKER